MSSIIIAMSLIGSLLIEIEQSPAICDPTAKLSCGANRELL